MKNFRSVRIPIFLVAFFIFGNAVAQSDSNGMLPSSFLTAAGGSLVYDVSLDYKEQHISGLLVAKEEEHGYHVVLLSKLGLKVMEFMLTPDGLNWIKTFDRLDKRMIKKALHQDFSVLYLMPLHNPEKVRLKKNNKVKIKKCIKLQVQLSDDHKRVIKAETKNFINFFKTKVIFYYINDDDIPDEICLTRNNVKMKIYMNLLKR
ncbi:hypothetical protein [Fulvivirga imtechensis]|nr:hypothetical protein [Fulvivirga imtechensis]